MKKILISLMLLSVPFAINTYIVDVANAAEEEYAKWGKVAMQKTQEKYPAAKIKDYKHIGRVHGTNTTVEKFKLWLKENNKEFGILINIEFDKKTERIVEITFREVPN
ncbi:DUF3889 domain-containing protein [Robertmurraya kyonggiensis]|uniref:DUF3889 domain-containing protein n=1 Tax=Robertmurraya kyonggiensis TaxID=1037680 RepID=A0A4U1D9K5_9BACI|nr:DUF3889 domain-containing protein [Robertmurraya kyonggiensis]TKC18788.1 DUF3889 domain-containing protein [Robertmurraya kyonggiensis]